VRAVLARQDGARRQLLLLDVGGRHPRAAVAIGEVDAAPHVATFVGGFTTTVGGDLDRYDRDLARLRSSSSGMAHGDVAVVTWLGYAAPQADEVLTPSRTVISSGVAARGGEELAAFVTGLDASREVPADQSVLAHSYGSVVLSFALRRPTGIDRAALFGSPGTGGAVRSVVDTGLKPGAFNVLGSIDDPVVAAGRVVLGPSAASVVGARTLSTYAPGGEGTPGARRTSRGHSDYLKVGSDSAFNLAAVVADRGDATVAESAAERARKAWR
jgi:pimeloyl-ACP methyl ester carboxylesterase